MDTSHRAAQPSTSRDSMTSRRRLAMMLGAAPHDDHAWDEVEYSRLAHAAAEQGLAGLLLQSSAGHRSALSQPSRALLKRQATLVAARNVAMMAELERALTALNRIDVPVMLFKGAALHLTLYKRRDLRPMGDLDLMVHPCDVDRTCRALVAIGYSHGQSLVRDDFFPTYYYETELVSPPPNRVRVDLHARPFRPLRLARTVPETAFWKESQRVRCGDASAHVPDAEGMLIHLAAHAAYHGCSRLMWLYDIHRFTAIHADSLDWCKVTSMARQWRLALPVYHGLTQTQSYFGDTFRDGFLDELRSAGIGWQDRLTLWHAPRDASSPIAHVLVNWACTPGFRFSTGYLLAHLIPGEGHLAESYPYRHSGWRACAMALRLMRATGRLLMSPIKRALHFLSRRSTRSAVPQPRPV